MSVMDLLGQCQALGIILTPGDGGKLRVSPPDVLPEVLRAQLLEHKAAILQLLTAPPADFVSEESCAICGSRERWQWLDGRTLCRVCLILDLAPVTLRLGDPAECWRREPHE
jgi:TubC N-terminal docking domain